MRRFLLLGFFLLVQLLGFSQVTTSLETTVYDVSDLDLGFNRRSDQGNWWSDTSFQSLLVDIHPDVLRYPAGTQANYWDWRTGQFLNNTDKNWGNKEVLTIPGFVNAIPARTKIVYVVNMARPTPVTGVSLTASEAVLKSTATLQAKINDMLAAIAEFNTQGKLPFAIELGNEFYFGNIESGIYEAKEINGQWFSGWNINTNQTYNTNSKRDAIEYSADLYLRDCAAVVAAIKAQYPNMKFAITTTKGGNPNSARERWNNRIIDALANNAAYAQLAQDIHAFTQHHYIKEPYGDQTVVTNNSTAITAIGEGITYPVDLATDVSIPPLQYKIWLTEYGATKPNAELTWTAGLRYATFTYGWLHHADRIEQLDWHYVSDDNTVKVGAPMVLAPVGIVAKELARASVDMDDMQFITFANNPTVSGNLKALYGIKFKNSQKETLFIINMGSANINPVTVSNLFDYNGASTWTRHHSSAPYVTDVFDGSSNIIENTSTPGATINVRKFSINVIETQNTLSNDDHQFGNTKIYPNPASTVLHITSDLSIDKVSVYGLDGKKLGDLEITNNLVGVSQLSTGMYLLRIEARGMTSTKKIFKK